MLRRVGLPAAHVLLLHREVRVRLVRLMHLGMRLKRRWTSEWHSLILKSALRKRAVAVEVSVPRLLALQRHLYTAL